MIKSYSTYRETGLLWAGAVPTHWSNVPHRRALRLINRPVGERWEDTVLLSLTKRGVIVRDVSSGEGKFPASFETYQVVEPNELIFCLFDMDETPRTIGRSHNTGMVTGAYSCFKVNDAEYSVRFLEWYFISLDDAKRFRPLYTGLRKVVQKSRFLSAQMASPPLPEQRAIADYLDHETAKIDALIGKQEQLIETLFERRVAVISNAVCRGLDASVDSVATQSDWIGDVPTHWTTSRLKNAISSTQVGAWGDEPNGDGDDVLCVRVADFDRPRLRAAKEIPTLRSLPLSEQEPRLLSPNDLLLEKSGGTGLNPVGFVAIFEGADRPAVTSNFVVRLRLEEDQAPRYWLYSFAASYATKLTARSVKQTTGIQNLDQSHLFDEVFPFPPLDEQVCIAEYLDEQTAKIDLLISKAERFIELAKERRSALITAAVTGQIDTRPESIEEAQVQTEMELA